MITISEKAKNHLSTYREEEGYDVSYHVRVSVKGGGCSGLMYDLSFDDTIKDTDEVFEDGGVKVLVVVIVENSWLSVVLHRDLGEGADVLGVDCFLLLEHVSGWGETRGVHHLLKVGLL